MSSMTKEQKKEYAHILAYTSSVEMIQITGESTYDWLNKNMLDWRGLIPMGLAIDATNLNIYQTMWRDENGFKHNEPSPYEQRKIEEYRSQMTFEEKYKEKVEEACRWLNDFLYADFDNGIIKVHPLAYKSKKEIFDDFREMMQID